MIFWKIEAVEPYLWLYFLHVVSALAICLYLKTGTHFGSFSSPPRYCPSMSAGYSSTIPAYHVTYSLILSVMLTIFATYTVLRYR